MALIDAQTWRSKESLGLANGGERVGINGPVWLSPASALVGGDNAAITDEVVSLALGSEGAVFHCIVV